jgi:hypothetical protein
MRSMVMGVDATKFNLELASKARLLKDIKCLVVIDIV